MRESEHYELKLVEGSDIVNPLVQDVPNYETIDEEMYKNKMAGIHTATELLSGSVHAITRSFGDSAVFRFTATANYVAGETFTVDAVQVTALLPNGEALGNGAYVIGSEVLCVLVGTRLTLFVPNENAYNAQRLGGEEPSYYGTATAVAQAQSLAEQVGQVAQETASTVSNLSNDVANLYDLSNEVVVGKWDGKNVYRKALTVNIGNAINTTYISTTNIENIENILKIEGGFNTNNGYHYSINSPTNNYMYTYVNINGFAVCITNNTSYLNSTAIIFVTYLKTE